MKQALDERIAQLKNEISRLQNELALLRSQKFVDTLLKSDGHVTRENNTIIRTELGLTVKGTRLTLYYIIDELKKNNSLKNIRDIYELTDQEMLDILDYIHLHKDEVEQEYQQIVKSSEENKKYWETKNQDLMSKTYQQREVVLTKLREWREQYHASHKE